MTRINREEIKQMFVERLSERRFLGKEYAIYLYSISGNNEDGTEYKLRLDAFATTSGFNQRHGIPFPIEIGHIRIVPYEKYQLYAFGRGGEINSCGTLYNEEPFLIDSNSVKNPSYWDEKFVYISGFQLEEIRLVIFLVFDIDPDERVENQLRFI